MSRPIRIEPETAAELDAASRWYDNRRPGLGLEFLETIDLALNQMCNGPVRGL